VGEFVLAVQPGVPHPIARVLEALIRRWILRLHIIATAAFVLSSAAPLRAQEVVGKRFFPDQLVLTEPFVEDELSLPSIVYLHRGRADGQRSARLLTFGGELKKRITEDLELSIAGGLTRLDADDRTVTGFDNLELGVKYQFLRSTVHEAVAAVAVLWEVGGTGREASGAESFDTVRPALLVGKGLGDVPEGLALLRPLAITARLGATVPVGDRTASLDWGAVFEYSIPYLDAFVRPVQLPPPLNRFVPLVEIDVRTDVSGHLAGRTRGTVNPGVVWISDVLQIGTEAVIPVDSQTGHGVGVRAFVRFPLEAIFGDRAGEPIFGHR
jgi:hypothetical protein